MVTLNHSIDCFDFPTITDWFMISISYKVEAEEEEVGEKNRRRKKEGKKKKEGVKKNK